MTADVNVISLAQSAKQGDRDAFAELYAMLWRDLYRFCLYMLGHPQDAEDAVQETVLDAFRAIASLRDETAFRPWLFTIAARRCKAYYRDRTHRPDELPLDAADHFLDGDSADGALEDALCVYQAIGRLQPDERLIVLLASREGYPCKEIARMLRRPEGTVRARLCRALKKLRIMLGKDCFLI